MISGGEGSLSAPPAVPPVAPPSDPRLADYSILEPIGNGLRGTVYRARTARGRAVALKVFNRGVGIDPSVLRRFSPGREDSIVHPNLVPVEAVGESEGKPFCAMALLRGDSLESVLAELRGERRGQPHLSPLGPGTDGRPRPGFIRQAVSLLLEVAEGLERAHRAGIVHGRLSPRNLIFSPSGRLVVTDFGAPGASGAAGRAASGGARGVGNGVSHDLSTLAYRSPEEIEPFPEGVDARADVYALGAILYELLTRLPPFSGRNPQAVREAIAEGRFVPPSALEPTVSQETEAVILRAMALDSADRYPTVLDLAQDLRKLLQLEATEAGMEAVMGAGIDAGTEAGAGTIPAPPHPPAVEELPVEPPVKLSLPPPPAETAILLLRSPAPTPAVEASPRAPRGPSEVPSKGSWKRLVGITGAFILAGAAVGWTWLTLSLHQGNERKSTALRHVASAALALAANDPSAAGEEMVEARRLGIDDPSLERIEVALRPSGGDPLLADLSHPRPAVRREAVREMARAVRAGERPGFDLAVLTGALGDGDPSVRREGIAALSGWGSSRPLFAAFPIGEGLPPLEIDGLTFISLVEALAGIGDGPAEELLLAFRFDDFAALDGALEDGPLEERLPGEGSAFAFLPPNIRVWRSAGDPGSSVGLHPDAFAVTWIRARGRLGGRAGGAGGGEVILLARRVLEGEPRLIPLLGEVVEALVEVGDPDATSVLAALSAPFSMTHGPRIVDGLLGLGALDELLDLARSPVPDSLRALAVAAAGKAALIAPGGPVKGVPGAAESLLGLLRGDPHPPVRREAFKALLGMGSRHASRKVLGAALEETLFDHALRDEALGILERIPLREALPTLLGLLRRGDSDLRARAAGAIGATGDPSALIPLAFLLLEDDEEVQARAFEAMRGISAPQALRLAAGILPARDTSLLDLALEVARCPLEPGESPALRLLAMREPLGLGGSDDPPQALREARRARLREALPSSDDPAFFIPERAAWVARER